MVFHHGRGVVVIVKQRDERLFWSRLGIRLARAKKVRRGAEEDDGLMTVYNL